MKIYRLNEDINDKLAKQIEWLDDNFAGMSCSEVMEVLDENEEDYTGDEYDLAESAVNSPCYLIDGVTKATSALDDLIRDTVYDNGRPLTTDRYNYFEHYDRDQDFDTYFEDEYISHFKCVNGKITVVLDLDMDELKRMVPRNFDCEWAFDFNRPTDFAALKLTFEKSIIEYTSVEDGDRYQDTIYSNISTEDVFTQYVDDIDLYKDCKLLAQSVVPASEVSLDDCKELMKEIYVVSETKEVK